MSTGTFDSQEVYTNASDGYSELSERLWPWAADGLTSRLLGQESGDHRRPRQPLPATARVLDAGCGPGGVTVRLARRLGEHAHVTGIDISEGMLDHARDLALSWGRPGIVFRHADMNVLDEVDLPPDFDGISAGLSLFLAPDIVATAEGLWKRLRPGGRMALSVVSEQFFAPAFDHLLELLRDAGVEHPYIPWQRVHHQQTLRATLAAAGIDELDVETDVRQVALDSATDWMAIIEGTGIRALLDDLSPEARAEVQTRSVQWLDRRSIRSLAFGVLFAVADKPANKR